MLKIIFVPFMAKKSKHKHQISNRWTDESLYSISHPLFEFWIVDIGYYL